MKRVLVIGCSGGGKSVFSRALAERTGLPLHHLDNLYWNADGTQAPKQAFREGLARLLAEDAWILDGNFRSTPEQRLAACDTVFFLDYPTEVCLQGVAERMGKPRPDLPWVETKPDEAFLEFIRTFSQHTRPRILELLERHSDREIHVFHSREEAAEYLRNDSKALTFLKN